MWSLRVSLRIFDQPMIPYGRSQKWERPTPTIMKDPDQQAEIKRVDAKLADAIITFCICNETFRAEDLRQYVREAVDSKSAPASADRILRLLREKGIIIYEVVNRRASLYRVISVHIPATAAS